MVRYISSGLCGLFWLGWACIRFRPAERLPDIKSRSRNTMRRWIAKGRSARLLRTALAAHREDSMERELCGCLAYMQNLITAGRAASVSAELLLQELSELSEHLSPAFHAMMHSLRLGDEQAAEQAFCGALSRDYTLDVARLIIAWETTDPKELAAAIEAYRDLLRNRRHTAACKRDEWISDLAYFPVVMNAMVLLLNFMYVAYFIEQREWIVKML